MRTVRWGPLPDFWGFDPLPPTFCGAALQGKKLLQSTKKEVGCPGDFRLRVELANNIQKIPGATPVT